MQNLFDKIYRVLRQDDRLIAEDKLMKNKAIELALNLDADLLKILLNDEVVKNHFFQKVDKIFVFDKVKFINFLNNKSFLPDSYTAFKNKIGLTTNENFITENNPVVLSWAYKDCVLQGGQSKEEQSVSEVFFNKIIATDEIDRLFHPKAIYNIQNIKNGKIGRLTGFLGNENLLIKGNNLITLHSLKKNYTGKIKLIYIDPPFNTGKDSFSYNDKFTHSTWLTFMKNRLEIARELLTPDGSIFVHLDHNEAHYCKVLMDEIFGRENFINEIIWCYTGPGSPGMKQFNRKHDNILWYSKGEKWTFNSDEVRIPSEVHSGGFNGEMDKKLSTDYTEKGKIPEDWWQFAVASRFKIDGVKRTGYNTEKPFKLIERIIKAASNEGDFVLDFFAGSGTTAFVANDLKRRFIAVEQMDETIEIAKERLKKVSDFVYFELVENKNISIGKLIKFHTKEHFWNLYISLKKSASIKYTITEEQLSEFEKNFENMDFGDCVKFVTECFDFNSLYVNFSEIDDVDYGLSDYEKKANHLFYKK